MHIIKKYIIYPCAFACVFMSCKKSFLDKAPESSLTTGTFYKSANDAESGLTGAYNSSVVSIYYQYDDFLNSDGRSDNCYVNGDNVNAEQPLENFTYAASNSNIVRDWQAIYTDITADNTVLDNVPAISDPVWTNGSRKQQILGEAKFLRALGYYQLVTLFGGVPVITSVGGDYYPKRNTVTEVYAQIFSDLKSADSVLPVAPYNGQFGRATKGAADALLAKAYAQSGDYANCLIYCNKVINGNNYSLVPNYANLFGMANKNNVESIYELQYDGAPIGAIGPEIFLYVPTDGWPKRDIGSYSLIKAFRDAGDVKRFNATFNWQQTGASFNMPINAWRSDSTIPFMIKQPDPGGFASGDNNVLIRLADIILLAAEANNQLNNTAAAITGLNQIRTRAGLPNTTAGTKSTLATAILNERQLELVHEANRWDDLLRADANGTVNLVALMNGQTDRLGKNFNYGMNPDKHQFIFPIPAQDMQLNKNLTQNPGY